jgi:lipid-A-disaccharide synthase
VSPPRIFISAGEPSGDLHGAALIRALRAAAPDAEIVALGGPKMEAAGARLLANILEFGVIGFAPILGSVPRYLRLLIQAGRFLESWRPDVAVTIDCPGFHFLLARRFPKLKIPALWYIPPQLWAWAPWRVKKLRRRFSRVACVLPNELEFFRRHNVPAVFVGHPVVDHLRSLTLDKDFIRTLRPATGGRLIALFPGSRPQEVTGILARQLAVARVLAERHPPCTFVMALAAEEHRAWTAPLVAASGLEIRAVVGRTHEVQSAADLALAKSGTTTLELLCYETPMAVFYNVGWLEWNLAGRWLIKSPFLSLPNALAGRRIVPEYMWNRPPSPPEIDEVSALLVDDDRRGRMRADLAAAHTLLDPPGPARLSSPEAAAREVLGLVHK